MWLIELCLPLSGLVKLLLCLVCHMTCALWNATGVMSNIWVSRNPQPSVVRSLSCLARYISIEGDTIQCRYLSVQYLLSKLLRTKLLSERMHETRTCTRSRAASLQVAASLQSASDPQQPFSRLQLECSMTNHSWACLSCWARCSYTNSHAMRRGFIPVVTHGSLRLCVYSAC